MKGNPPKNQRETLTCWRCSRLAHCYPGEIRQQKEKDLQPKGVWRRQGLGRTRKTHLSSGDVAGSQCLLLNLRGEVRSDLHLSLQEFTCKQDAGTSKCIFTEKKLLRERTGSKSGMGEGVQAEELVWRCLQWASYEDIELWWREWRGKKLLEGRTSNTYYMDVWYTWYVCIYKYIHVCMIYTHMIYTCIYTCIPIHVCVWCTCISMCVHIYIHVYSNTCYIFCLLRKCSKLHWWDCHCPGATFPHQAWGHDSGCPTFQDTAIDPSQRGHVTDQGPSDSLEEADQRLDH